MGVEGGTRFIPEAALRCQGTSYVLSNAFQLGWLQAWGGQVIYSNAQWNRPSETWPWGLRCLPQSVNALLPAFRLFSELHQAVSVLCLAQPVLPAVPAQDWNEACYRSSLNVLAVQRKADCSMPAQSIQCLAKARLKIATPTRQDSKRKNLAHIFPLRGDFSSLPFFFSFFSFFLSFFKKRESPCLQVEIQNAQVVSSQFCDPWTSVGLGVPWEWAAPEPWAKPALGRKEFSSEWKSRWARRPASDQGLVIPLFWFSKGMSALTFN